MKQFLYIFTLLFALLSCKNELKSNEIVLSNPTEIIQDGITGWLVEPDNINQLVNAIQNIDKIDRYVCRKQAETEYSLERLGDRMEQWLFQLIP